MKDEIKKHVGKKIREYRTKKKMSQKELGLKVGVKHNTISSYESGTNEPEQNILYLIAKALDISIDDLFPPIESDRVAEGSAEYDIKKLSSSKYKYIPTAISAGLPIEVDGITEIETISIPDTLMGKWAAHEDVFVTKICGDSMDRIMPDGSLIAVKPVETVEQLKNGDIVVFSNSHEYSVKYFQNLGDKLIFKPASYNSAHHDQPYNIDEELHIHGKVVVYIVELD